MSYMEKQYLEEHLPITSVRVLAVVRAALCLGCLQIKQRATYSAWAQELRVVGVPE